LSSLLVGQTLNNSSPQALLWALAKVVKLAAKSGHLSGRREDFESSQRGSRMASGSRGRLFRRFLAFDDEHAKGSPGIVQPNCCVGAWPHYEP
jgi:hypothetical protein